MYVFSPKFLKIGPCKTKLNTPFLGWFSHYLEFFYKLMSLVYSKNWKFSSNPSHGNAIFSALRLSSNLIPICVGQVCPWVCFVFPSLLPHTTWSNIETAPKLVNFCISLNCLYCLHLIPIRVTQTCPWPSFMFPSLLPQTTRSTIETAPKLVNFCVCKSYFKNVVNSGAASSCGQILNYKKHLITRTPTELTVYWSLTAYTLLSLKMLQNYN